MYAMGSTVVVRKVDHLGRWRRPRRLLGKQAVVTGHVGDMVEVAVLGRLAGPDYVRWMFNDDDLEAA